MVAESPAVVATNVGVSSSVSVATFNDPVQSSTISFSLTPSGGSPVAASFSYNSSTQTATLTPSAALAYSTTYTATVSGAVSNQGVAMTGPFNWKFTTVPNWPAVASETPVSATLGVALASPLTATFNQAVQSSTIVFMLTNEFGNSVSGTVSYNSSTDTATFTPRAPLAASTTYIATMSGVQNSAGLAMNGPFTWEFITDPGVPIVSSETPASGATGVGTAMTVTAAFSEPVQSSTISFTLTPGAGKPIPATVTYNLTTFVATLTPSSLLSASTTYTASVSGAQDLAGDPMTAPVAWSFTTSAAPAIQNGLVAEWNFNEGSGTTTADDTRNGHTGTLVGSVSWTAGLVGPGPYALSFNPSNDGHVTVPDSPTLEFSASQSFSLTAWVYVPYLPGQYEGIVDKSVGVGNWYGIWIDPSNQWEVSDGSNSSSTNLFGGTTVTTGWTQVAEVQNGSTGTLALYVNGVQVAAGAAQQSNGAGNLWIGGDTHSGQYFNGTVDDIRVYNRALSERRAPDPCQHGAPTVSAETPASDATPEQPLPPMSPRCSPSRYGPARSVSR